MTESSSQRSRGWPVVILVAGLIVVLSFTLVPAIELFLEQRDDAALASTEFANYRAQIAARPRLQSELEMLKAQEASQSSMLSGTGAPLAAASMQSLVKDIVERHGGQVRSVQPMPASVSGGLEKVTVQFEVSLPLGGLKSATYDIETGSPFLFVDAVEISPELSSGAIAAAPDQLHVEWTIHGYRKAGSL